MKKRILGILLLLLAAVGICIGAGAYKKPANPEEAEQPMEEYLFSLDENPVLAVYLQSGDTGKIRTFNSENDIRWFVSKFKMLRYDMVKERESSSATGGWTFRLIVDGMYGDRDFIVGPQYLGERINGKRLTYRLTPESVPIMEEIIALMPR